MFWPLERWKKDVLPHNFVCNNNIQSTARDLKV